MHDIMTIIINPDRFNKAIITPMGVVGVGHTIGECEKILKIFTSTTLNRGCVVRH